jgi:hypothetical protein
MPIKVFGVSFLLESEYDTVEYSISDPTKLRGTIELRTFVDGYGLLHVFVRQENGDRRALHKEGFLYFLNELGSISYRQTQIDEVVKNSCSRVEMTRASELEKKILEIIGAP